MNAFKAAGFEVLEAYDVAVEYKQRLNTIEWYDTLLGKLRLSQLKHTKWGRMFTQKMVDVLETVGIAPQGTSETHAMLCRAAEYLAIGGQMEIFTPMLFILARKPL